MDFLNEQQNKCRLQQAPLGSCSRRRASDANNQSNSSYFHQTSTNEKPRRRVSWSDRYSVSVFDGSKSPAKGGTAIAQFLWSKDEEMAIVCPSFPTLPFGRTNNEIQATVKTDDVSISYTKNEREPKESKVMDAFRDIIAANQVSTLQWPLIESSSFDETLMSPNKSSLPGYHLGDPPKHNGHMVMPTSFDEGIKYVSTLQPMDFAFVLCNDGMWVYSIVCDIIMPNGKVYPQAKGRQPRIRFVLDRHGSTKSIAKKNWGHKIRLINGHHSKQLTPSLRVS